MNSIGHKLAVVAASAFVLAASFVSAQAQDVVIVSSGGGWQEAQDSALWGPAAEALGITYAQDTAQNWAEARTQVESGAVTWDIFQVSLADEPLMRAAGMLEKLDGVIDPSAYAPGSYTEYFVPNSNYTTLIAWNKDVYGEDGPKSAADFFDTEKFPGKRGMWNQPGGMLEAAAMAAGATKENVYEFLSTTEGKNAALDQIKAIAPHVGVWWESGAQAAQLVKDGEVDMIMTWGGRVMGAINDGANWAYTFNDGQLGVDGYIVLKGAPHRDTAMKFLAEMSKPEYQAHLADTFATAPAHLGALELSGYSPEKIATMASAPQNVGLQYAVNPAWWAENGTWASEAYDNERLAAQ